ncbi:RNA recognition motif [Carpediemonas membranifera]|uniref:RNA recognition motif n=1 Tax=Carpediemonas membranifera TaxID=201153 RepID=A0A8J6BUR7_9EUKA|nr:RNA recognition motif [Carpediemonas membranifera]|eukprot:KAG9390636.1 RNA recognition motif [Carpediemonas membranifera]
MAEAADYGRIAIVTNLSNAVTEQILREFFSFCGEMQFIATGLPDPDGVEHDKKFAAIKFKLASSANTALLLTNAPVVDKPVTVTLADSVGMEQYVEVVRAYLAEKASETKSEVRSRSWSLGFGRGSGSADEEGNVIGKVFSRTKQSINKIQQATETQTSNITRNLSKFTEASFSQAKEANTRIRAQLQEVDTAIGLSKGVTTVQQNTRERTTKLVQGASQASAKFRQNTQAGAQRIVKGTQSTIHQADERLKFSETAAKTSTLVRGEIEKTSKRLEDAATKTMTGASTAVRSVAGRVGQRTGSSVASSEEASLT